MIQNPQPQWDYSVRTKTAPITKPVTLNDVKTFARLDAIDEDALLEMFIDAAVSGAEEYMGRALIQQTLEMSMDFWPESYALNPLIGNNGLQLARPPLVNVLSIKTVSDSGVTTTWDLDNFYWIKGDDALLVPKQSITPPSNTNRDVRGTLIEYIAGYSDTSYTVSTDHEALRNAVPMPIKIAIMLWSSMLYSMRGKITANDPPPEARALLSPYKIVRV